MSSVKRNESLATPVYDSAEAIDRVGSLAPMSPDDRDGAIAKIYDRIDPGTVMGWEPLRKRASKAIGVAALTLAITGANYFSQDVIPEQKRLENTHSSVTHTQGAQYSEDSRRGTIGFTGWGTTNAKNIVTSLPYEAIGQEAYFTYDPSGISHKKNAEAAIEYAAENNIDRLVLHGSSMGGNMALKTAALLHENEDAPEVEAIILDCTPLSADAVWPERRMAGDRMLQLTSVIPGAENSRMILGSAMMVDRKDQYIDGMDVDWQAAFITARGVRNRILSGRDASIELRNAQLRVILSEGTEGDLKTLSQEKNGKKPPHIFLLVPADVKSDATVNNEKSAEILVSLGQKYGIDVSVLSLPAGTGHANPAQRPEEYGSTLTTRVFPIIEKERQEAQLAKYIGKRNENQKQIPLSDLNSDKNTLAEVEVEKPLAEASTPTG